MSTLVTAVSHAVAGGGVPHPALVLVGFALALLFCIGLTGRALSPVRLLGAVAASQALLHGVFAMSGPPPASLVSGAMASMAHAHGATAADAVVMAGHHNAAASTDAVAHLAGGVDVGMLLAHALAGLVTALALAAGERAFWGLFDSLRLAGAALLRFAASDPAPVPLLRPASAVIAGAIFRPRERERRMLALRHRGPPALAV